MKLASTRENCFLRVDALPSARRVSTRAAIFALARVICQLLLSLRKLFVVYCYLQRIRYCSPFEKPAPLLQLFLSDRSSSLEKLVKVCMLFIGHIEKTVQEGTVFLNKDRPSPVNNIFIFSVMRKTRPRSCNKCAQVRWQNRKIPPAAGKNHCMISQNSARLRSEKMHVL